MRKVGLKKRTGCLRCKRRHKRCDELKPKCSYCTRWQLECVWPDNTASETRVEATTSPQSPDAPHMLDADIHLSQQASPTGTNDDISNFHPLHGPPHLQNSGGPSTGSKWVQEFLVANTCASNTYNAADLHSEIVRGWPEFAFLDKAACATRMSSWARSSVKRRQDSPGPITGLGFETLTLSQLRRAISPRAPVSEEMLLAVTVYFIMSAIDLFDTVQLRDMVESVNMMVMSFGGIDAVLQRMSASVVLAVLHCDMFGSLLSTEPHFFVQLEKPRRPQTLADSYRDPRSNVDISLYISADVVDIYYELALLLRFREQSNQHQALSACESRHLLLLDQWINYRLGVLQTSHINDHSLSELFIVALVILKQEILADTTQHPSLASTLLTRLQTSISHFQLQLSTSAPESALLSTITMWTSLIALTGIPLTLQRLWFADYLHSSLNRRYGPIQDWPDFWDRDLRVELQQFLWHERIAARYTALCTEIEGHRQARGFT